MVHDLVFQGARRRFLSGLILAACPLAFCGLAATANAALASHYYVGTYQAGARDGIVTVQLVEALPHGTGFIGWITVDSVTYLGRIYPTETTVDITWYTPSGNYQIPLGTIHGNLNADGTTITGSFRQGLKVGTCRLIAG